LGDLSDGHLLCAIEAKNRQQAGLLAAAFGIEGINDHANAPDEFLIGGIGEEGGEIGE
jgi:hypothetical protein